MTVRQKTRVIGVLGGMGPLSSAEFLKTIYECNQGRKVEQELPTVVVYSDPTFPDRTTAFLKGEDDVVLQELIAALQGLRGLGASRIVICCVTIHYLLPRLSPELREPIVSLLDVIHTNLSRYKKKHLLISSSSTRRLKLFENHPQWELNREHFLFLDESDQKRVHEYIYELKMNRGMDRTVLFLQSLLSKYEVDSFIVGCSEIHMLAKHFMRTGENKEKYTCVDPFQIIAEKLPGNVP